MISDLSPDEVPLFYEYAPPETLIHLDVHIFWALAFLDDFY